MTYKKIVEDIMNIINAAEKSDIGFTNICAYIDENCPELKENEDERIRKEIIDYIKTGTYHKDWIAWLEKQGEQPQGKPAHEAVREDKVDSQKMTNKIIKEVADLVTENTIFCTKEVLTSDEAAKYLGISKSYLYKLTSWQKIPHFKPMGKMCYFNRQELETWLQSNRVAMEKELKKIDNK